MTNPALKAPSSADCLPIRLPDEAPKRMRRRFTSIVVAVAAVAAGGFTVDTPLSVEHSVVSLGAAPMPVAGAVHATDSGDATILSDPPNPVQTEPPVPAEPAPSHSLDQATAHLDPGGGDPGQRVIGAYEAAIPARWRARVPVDLRIIGGGTSWSHSSGLVEIGAAQTDTWRHVTYVVAHEWAHQAAYEFGTGSYLGAPPAAFPGQSGAEQLAECVAQVLVDYRWPNPYPHCPGAAMEWTRNWLNAGPPGTFVMR